MRRQFAKYEDINECNDTSACPYSWSVCVNAPGSFICVTITIRLRSVFEGKTCSELADGEGDGDKCEHKCTDVTNGYECSCNKGYEVDTDGHKCKDVDECKVWPCEQKCVNTVGSYQCGCDDPFTLAEDGQACQVKKTCDDGNNGGCAHVCKKLYASSVCYCRQGYRLDTTDGKSCHDIDECTASGPCSQLCTNTVGSYHCSCTAGYRQAGRMCTDIDECKENQTVCLTFGPVCFNTPGSYTCMSLTSSLLDQIKVETDKPSDYDEGDFHGDFIGDSNGGGGGDTGDVDLGDGPEPTKEPLATGTQMVIVIGVMAGAIFFLVLVAVVGIVLLYRRIDKRRASDSTTNLMRSRRGDVESLPRGGFSMGEQKSYTFNP